MRRIDGLDGIRCFAVLAVVAAHAHVPGLHGGGLGVDMFFALSGYLITTLLLREHAASGRIHLGMFWGRRAVRLLPALIVLVVVVDVVALTRPLWLGPYADSTLQATPSVLLYFSNWLIVVENQAALGAFGPLWSLSVEEQFYLLWPLVVLVALRFRSPRRTLTIVIGVIVAAVVVARFATFDPADVYSTFATTFRMDSLLYGALLALMLDGGLEDRIRRVSTWLVFPAGAWILVALIIQPDFDTAGGTATYLYYTIGMPAVAVSTCIIIGHVVTRQRAILARTLSLPPLAFLGRISYGVYLWHYPLLVWLQVKLGLGSAPWALFAVGAAASIAVAAATWFLVERPIARRLRPHLMASTR